MNPESVPDYLAIQQPCRKYGMDEGIHSEQVVALRRMTPGEKFAQIVQMYHVGISLKMEELRIQHSDWSEEKLRWVAQRITTYSDEEATLYRESIKPLFPPN